MIAAILICLAVRPVVLPPLAAFDKMRGEVVSRRNAKMTTIGMPTSTSPASSDFHRMRAAAWFGSAWLWA